MRRLLVASLVTVLVMTALWVAGWQLSQTAVGQTDHLGSIWSPESIGGALEGRDHTRPRSWNSAPATAFLYQPFENQPYTITAYFDHSCPDYDRSGVDLALTIFSGHTLVSNCMSFNKNGTRAPSCTGRIKAFDDPTWELPHLFYSGHDGYDSAVSGRALAAARGLATYVDDKGDCGWMVEITHDDLGSGYRTRYCHLEPNSNQQFGVEWGTVIWDAGQPIGVIDNSGASSGVHLHFSVWRYNGHDWTPTDPFGWDYSASPEDPLAACNGEQSHNLWVDGWPHLQENPPGPPLPPTEGEYRGGWFGEPDPYPSTDNATFVSDVTIPDGTVVSPGQGLHKVWRTQNTGSSTWGSGYEWVFISGEQMGAPSSVSVPSTSPGNTADIAVDMTGPSSLGEHVGTWRMRNPQVVFFGEQAWIKVRVEPDSPPSPTDIEIVDVDYRSVVTPGQSFRPRVTARVNQGQLLESRGDMLRNTDGNLYGAWPHVAVVGTVNAGQTYTFEFYENDPITAPQGEGTYESRWRVWRDGNWAGPEITIRFDVRSGGGTRPHPPTLVSPSNWYVSRDGSTPTLCASAPAGLQYYFQIYESHDIPESGWISSNCWTPPTLGPYGYQWHVKARGPGTGLESDWSETWHFNIDSQELTMDDLVFEPSSPSAAEDVRVYTCVRGFGGIGLGLKIKANTATDGSASGDWQWIHLLGTFCYDRNDSNTWPNWSTRSQEDGTHLLRATGYHGDDTIVKEATYTLQRRRPSDAQHLTPETNGWVNSRTVTFTWRPALRATSYQLLVATVPPTPQNALLNVTLDADTTTYTYTSDQSYPQLYAQVLAINELGSAGGYWPFGIDTTPPSASVTALPTTTTETHFTVSWSGSDNTSGVRWYDVQYRDGARGEWTDWQVNVTQIATILSGQPGHTYCFRARAMDNATNWELYPEGDGDTCTLVDPAAAPPTPWWNSDYAFKRNLLILNNDGHSLPGGYPMRLHFDNSTTPTASELYDASESAIKGDDFRIVYNNQTELPRFVQTFRSDRIDIWFNLEASIEPNPGSDSTSYQLYYGNPAATDPPGTINDIIPEPSDANTLGLWRFQEGSGSTITDSSRNGRYGTAVNMGWEEGKFGPAGVFNGTNSLVNLGNSPAFNAPNIALEAWIKQTSPGWSPEWTILRKDADDRSLIYDFLTQENRVYLRLNGNNGYVRSNTHLQTNRWYHVAGTYDGSTIKVYINGALDNSVSYSVPLRYGSSTTLYLGGDGQNNNKYFTGDIQNARISNIAPPSFPYGSFGEITIEPSSAVGDPTTPPIAGSPDLVIENVVTYPGHTEGQVLVQAVLDNAGDASTINGFWTDLYADHLPIGPGDYVGSINQWIASPIEVGSTITLTTLLTDISSLGISSNFGVSGIEEITKTLYLQADTDGVVNDSDRANNISPGVEVCFASADLYESDNDPANAHLIEGTETHNIHVPSDEDWVKFNVVAGTTYAIETSNLGIAADTYIYLYDTDGTTLLTANDDYGGSLASRIEWQAPANGTYYVVVKHWNPNIGGCGTTYDLSIAVSEPDLPYKTYFPIIMKGY